MRFLCGGLFDLPFNFLWDAADALDCSGAAIVWARQSANCSIRILIASSAVCSL